MIVKFTSHWALANFNHIGMCLAIPKQVLSVKSGVATVKKGKGREEVGSIISVKKGDWVLTQNNVIIKKISQKQAREINKLILTF